MTALVSLSATYDGTELVAVVDGQPRMLIRCVRGLDESWEVRGTDSVIPGAHGRAPRNRKRDRLVIELAGPVIGCGDTEGEQMADIRQALEELRALFDPTRDPAELVVELEDGGTATIAARPINMLWAPDPQPVYREVSIELEAVGDDWLVATVGS